MSFVGASLLNSSDAEFPEKELTEAFKEANAEREALKQALSIDDCSDLKCYEASAQGGFSGLVRPRKLPDPEANSVF